MGKTCCKNSTTSNPVMTEHAYSDGIRHARILLLGPYPPPWGGIAVHIQRIKHKLEQQDNTVIVFDTIKRSSFLHYLASLLRILWNNRFDYLFYHTPYTDYSWIEMIMLVVYATTQSASCMLIEHDCRYILNASWLTKKVIAWFCAHTQLTIFMGLAPYLSYKKVGITLALHRIESPFLPPNIHTSYQEYPAALLNFVSAHRPLLVANAFQCTLIEGLDLYGIDQSIALCKQLKQQFPHIGLVFFLSTIGNDEYYHQIVSQLDEQIYLLMGDYQLWPIFKYTDCFIRPTRNENFGISVAEALYCKVPVVASNVCARPFGTVLYQASQLPDLIAKTTYVLQERGPAYEK